MTAADETEKTEVLWPTKVSFILTDLCNLRCRHCYAWKTHERRVLSTEVIVDTLAELGEWAGPYKLFLSGGEPTLHRGLVEIVQAAASKGGFVSIATNGIRMGERLAQELVLAGLGHADISLDGLTPETHDQIRGRVGAHARAVRAARLLHRFRTEHGRQTYINLQATITAYNVHELPALARWIREEGIGQLLLQPLAAPFWSSHDRAWLMRSDLWPRDTAAVEAVLDELIQMKRDGWPIDNSVEHIQGIREFYGWAPPPGSETLVDEDFVGELGQLATMEGEGAVTVDEVPRERQAPADEDTTDATRLDARYLAGVDRNGDLGPKQLFAALDINEVPADVRPERIDRCSIGWKVLNINHLGDVRLCHDMPPIGNINRNPLREIWTSPRASCVRELIAHCHEGCFLLNCNYCD